MVSEPPRSVHGRGLVHGTVTGPPQQPIHKAPSLMNISFLKAFGSAQKKPMKGLSSLVHMSRMDLRTDQSVRWPSSKASRPKARQQARPDEETGVEQTGSEVRDSPTMQYEEGLTSDSEHTVNVKNSILERLRPRSRG